MKRHHTLKRAFTLLELLVVVAIIAVLSAILFPVVHLVLDKGRATREVQAARTLITAYISYSGDNNGMLFPGYDRTVGMLEMPHGLAVSGPTAERYPFRLAQYYSYQFDQTILVNNNVAQIDSTNSYMVSCFPALGINYIFVGGDIQASGSMTFPDECTTRLATAHSSLLVFASAGGQGAPPGQSSTKEMGGYCILTPPNETVPMWNGAAWKNDSSPDDYGNVDPRYDNTAVCAFLGGNIRMLSIDELRDMRLWSRNALEQDQKDYLVPPPQHGGRL
jgi:prepilin-type N-terminal cleavage/methylation domain-containing protein